MAEVEKPVPVCVGFGYMEVRANQRDEERVKEPVDELKKHLCAFAHVGIGNFCVVVVAGWAQPGYFRDLGSVSTIQYSGKRVQTCMFCVT